MIVSWETASKTTSLILVVNALLVNCQTSFSDIVDVSYNCWRSVVIDSYVSSCFYSKNLTVDHDLRALLFYNNSYQFPGIFDPLYTAKTVVRINGSDYYGSGSLPLHNGSVVTIFSLNMPAITAALPSDELLKQKVVSFCGMRTFLRPVQDCIIDEISLAPSDNKFQCTSTELDGLTQMMKTSITNYNFYDQFCEPVFSCSVDPIEDCIRQDIGESAHMNLLSLPSICLVLSKVDTFTNCLKDKVWECHADEFSAYNSLITKLEERAAAVVTDPQSLEDKCKMVTINCQPEQGVANDLIIDECYQRLYDLGYGFALATADDSSSTLYSESNCLLLKDAQTKATKDRCGQTVVAAAHEIVRKLTMKCDENNAVKTSPTQDRRPTTEAPPKTAESVDGTTDLSDLIGALESSGATEAKRLLLFHLLAFILLAHVVNFTLW